MKLPIPTDLADLQPKDAQPTATVKTASFEEEVETRANNMFVAIKLQRDSERLGKAAEKRLGELLAVAQLPGVPTEDETIAILSQQIYDGMRTQRIKHLAEQAARQRFAAEFPELFKGGLVHDQAEQVNQAVAKSATLVSVPAEATEEPAPSPAKTPPVKGPKGS